MVDLACPDSALAAREHGAARRAWPSRTRPLAAHWRALRNVTEADPTHAPPTHAEANDDDATTNGTSGR